MLPTIHLVSLTHLVLVSLWGGVVATEAVLELYPYRRKALHENSIRYHLWVDLLVELPLLLGVLSTGVFLTVLAWPISATHWIKISAALIVVSVNVICIRFVIKRRLCLEQGASETELWQATHRIVKYAVVALPFAAAAAGLGLFLAYHRLLDLLR